MPRRVTISDGDKTSGAFKFRRECLFSVSRARMTYLPEAKIELLTFNPCWFHFVYNDRAQYSKYNGGFDTETHMTKLQVQVRNQELP